MVIDVSKYQAKVDWNAVKKNVDGAYIKATEGVGYIDPAFKSHVIGASAASVPMGFYHFATLNSSNVVDDAIAEAHSFLGAIKGINTSLPNVLDIEKNAAKLPPNAVYTWIKTFLDVVGQETAIYSYTPFLNENLPAPHALGKYKLWLASYTPTPVRPRGWDKIWLWQYTQKGKVPGIDGAVDLSTYL